MTKSPIVAELEAGARHLIDFFAAVDPAIQLIPITASEHPGGRAWSVKDHLAHLVQRESDFLPIARRLISGEADPLRLDHRGATPTDRAAFVNRENQSVVDTRLGQTFGDLLAEFSTLRSELVKLVSPLSDADLARLVSISPERQPLLRDILPSGQRHAAAHLEIVTRALDRASS